MKRWIALLLSLVLVAALALPAAADDGLGEAQALAALGLYAGSTAADALNEPLTRGEGTALLLRLIGGQHGGLGKNKHPFTDVPADLDDAVAWAYTNGLTRGVSETVFAPDEPMTRTMYLTMLFRALGYRDGVDFDWAAAEQLCSWAGLDAGEGGGAFTLRDAMTLTWRALWCVPVDQTVNDGVWLRLIARAAGQVTAGGTEAACLDQSLFAPCGEMTDPYGKRVPVAASLAQAGIGGAFTDPAVQRVPLALTFDGEPLAFSAGTAAYVCRMPGRWSVYHCTYVPLNATLAALGFALSYDAQTNTLTGSTPHGELVPQTGESASAPDGTLPELGFCQPGMRIVLDGKAVNLARYHTLKGDGRALYEDAYLLLADGEYYIPLDLLTDTLGVGTDGGTHLFSERLTKYTYAEKSAIYRSADGQYVLLWRGETLVFSGLPGAEVGYFTLYDDRASGVYDTLRIRLTDQAGRREDHVIDLLTMTHLSSALYDYAELSAIPEAGITLRGVAAPAWNSTSGSLHCDAFALTVGERTVWFRDSSLTASVPMALADLDGDGGEEILLFLSTMTDAAGVSRADRVAAFDRETLTQLTVETVHGAMVERGQVEETDAAWILSLGDASCTIEKPSAEAVFEKPQRGLTALVDGVLTTTATIEATGGKLVLTYARVGDTIRFDGMTYQP